MKRLIFYLFLICCISCTLKEQEKVAVKTYFDVADYFKNEAQRLNKINPIVDKTVLVNGKEENKKIKIQNWEREFSSFTAADINKTSWRGSFDQKLTDSLTVYTSASGKIPVKKLVVSFINKKVSSIKIFIVNTNDLYTSTDSLYYYPDSVYLIKKNQKISLMDEKKYQVIGRFIKN